MKIAFVSRHTEDKKWGGDLRALQSFEKGLKALDHEAWISPTLAGAIEADFIFLSNTCIDLRPDHSLLQLLDRPFGLIGFHEDALRWYGPAMGLCAYIENHLNDSSHIYPIERLFETPEIIYYFAPQPRRSNYDNYPILKDAKVCIATSKQESQIMLRDCPACRPEVLFLSPGFAEGPLQEINDDFLKLTGLKSGEYLLQVGRLEARKNQLGTLLATMNSDIPLVFITTQGAYPFYERLFFRAIQKWRKGPTLLISQNLPNMQDGNFRIIQMPGQNKLSRKMLLSAFAHAGLLIHPAFSETPGYTYLEAARLNIPMIASEWSTISEYFTDPATGLPILEDQIGYFSPYAFSKIGNAIPQLFGKKNRNMTHPQIFNRTYSEMGRELFKIIQNLQI